jgi:TonB family protein
VDTYGRQAGRSGTPVIAATLLLTVTVFTPPRLVSGEPPGLPGATTLGGGEVLIEVIVDKSGAVTRPTVLRSTPPYAQMVLEAVGRWRFVPAHIREEDGSDQIVEAPILIGAVYRAGFDEPTLGPAPVDLKPPSSNAPYPITMPGPRYPPLALFGGVVLLEVSLDEAGITRAVRVVRSNPPFDVPSRESVSQWKFRGASMQSRPVPSNAYILLGFVAPLVNPASVVTPGPVR